MLPSHLVQRSRAAVLATVSVGIELTRGPAAPGRTAELAYFVAVSQGERILDKRVFPLAAEFPPNTERVRLTGDDVELRLPTPGGASPRKANWRTCTPGRSASKSADPGASKRIDCSTP